MNSEIEDIFTDFKVDNIYIPIEFVKYTGKLETYLTYMETNISSSFFSDNELIGYVSYYDIDIYSKKNYFNIIKKVKEIMKQNGWQWIPSMTSSDMKETDTGYFHKTLCFSKERND